MPLLPVGVPTVRLHVKLTMKRAEIAEKQERDKRWWIYQEDNQEQRRTTADQAAKGQQEDPLPVNSGECFKTMP
jgi:hypothetical protein